MKRFWTFTAIAAALISMVSCGGSGKKLLPNVLLERPTVEDIMLSHTKGGMKNAAEFS